MYLQETVKAGNVREIRKKFSSRFGIKGIPRGEIRAITPEDMQKVNQNNAERKLRWILNENFKGGDYHIVLNYASSDCPDEVEARCHLEKFLRDIRMLYKKEGITLKYVSVTERGKRGFKKYHHHLVIPYIDPRKVSALWPWARIHFNPLDNTGQYKKLANYLVKRADRKKNGKRWSGSKNLVIPVPTNKVISRNSWTKEPRPPKGYYIETVESGISNVTGYPWQFYSMVKLPERKKHENRRDRPNSKLLRKKT